MEVKLLSYTANPQRVIYAAARQCYSKNSAYDIFKDSKETNLKKIKDFIKHLAQRNHLSPLEHVNFSFAIEGISRVCSHQLVRHRLASYSQQSQRYVNMDEFNFIIPPLIKNNKKLHKRFLKLIEEVKKTYADMKQILKEENLGKEAINQDLRFILPQAAETKIALTMNARQLLHFFGERMCMRAQWEIRALANKMFSLCNKILPEVFFLAGPKCKYMRYCPEGYTECPLYSKYVKSS